MSSISPVNSQFFQVPNSHQQDCDEKCVKVVIRMFLSNPSSAPSGPFYQNLKFCRKLTPEEMQERPPCITRSQKQLKEELAALAWMRW